MIQSFSGFCYLARFVNSGLKWSVSKDGLIWTIYNWSKQDFFFKNEMVRFILRVNFYVGHLARISYCTIVKNLQQGLKYHNFQLLSSKIRIWGDFVRKWIKKELSTIFMIDWTNGMSKNARYNKKSSMSFCWFIDHCAL